MIEIIEKLVSNNYFFHAFLDAVTTTQKSSVVVPANTHIKRDELPIGDARVKILTDAGCHGYQVCDDHDHESEECGNGRYGMTACSGKFRYFIHGCCKPTDTGSQSTLNKSKS